MHFFSAIKETIVETKGNNLNVGGIKLHKSERPNFMQNDKRTYDIKTRYFVISFNSNCLPSAHLYIFVLPQATFFSRVF